MSDYLLHGSLGATSHNQTVEVSVTDDVLDTATRRVLLLSPEAAFSLARNLIVAAESALRTQLLSMAAGECSRCGNVRQVDSARPSGHVERVHCPDCWPSAHRLPPNMAAWADDESIVLAR